MELSGVFQLLSDFDSDEEDSIKSFVVPSMPSIFHRLDHFPDPKAVQLWELLVQMASMNEAICPPMATVGHRLRGMIAT